jgi:FKBP-type peptidyl-prolyl cis-trans isomerase FkpA
VFRPTALLLVLLGAALAAAGCGSSPTAPTSSPAYSQTDLRAGTGQEAANGLIARVFYTGWIYDPSRPDSKGMQFDSNVGTEFVFEFVIGEGNVIEGWDRGIPGMRVGGARRLIIPPSLAYGSVRNGPIPPFSTLVFDVELIGLREVETPE